MKGFIVDTQRSPFQILVDLSSSLNPIGFADIFSGTGSSGLRVCARQSQSSRPSARHTKREAIVMLRDIQRQSMNTTRPTSPIDFPNSLPAPPVIEIRSLAPGDDAAP